MSTGRTFSTPATSGYGPDVQKFGEMVPYQHRVQAVAGGAVYSLPINLLTINQFFGKVMSPEEARDFIASKSSPIQNPANFEEQALSMIGPQLYHAFFRGYTLSSGGWIRSNCRLRS